MCWRTDSEGRCIDVSDPWLLFLGRSRADVMGFGWRKHVHPGDLERIRQEVAQHRARKMGYMLTFRVRHHTDAFVLVRASAEYQSDGGYVSRGYADWPADSRPPQDAVRGSYR